MISGDVCNRGLPKTGDVKDMVVAPNSSGSVPPEMKKGKRDVSRIVMIGCFSVLVVIGGAGPLVHLCLCLTALVLPLYLR